MNTLISRYINKRFVTTVLASMLLLVTLSASLAAGPDEPKASNVNSDWEVFEGHAYADNRAAPAGVSLVACLGGCEDGYQSEPVITGKDGIYHVKVEPGQVRPTGRMVTFWLMDQTDRIEADQDVLFRGQGEARVLDLNFIDLPVAGSADSSHSTAASATGDSGTATGSASGNTTGAQPGDTAGSEPNTGARTANGGVTTDLTVPSATELGLVPSNSPQSYLNTVSYGGLPLLPGFIIVLGLLVTLTGVSMLLYRRRLTWQ